MPRALMLAAVVLSAAMTGTAQTPYPTKFSRALVERPDVRAAMAYVDRNFDRQVAEWIRITEIPAPSGQETRRAAYVSG